MIEAKVSAVSMLVLAHDLHCFTKSQYWVLRGSKDGTVQRTAHSLMSCTQPVSDDNTCSRSDHSCSETGTCRLALIHVTISVYQSIINKSMNWSNIKGLNRWHIPDKGPQCPPPWIGVVGLWSINVDKYCTSQVNVRINNLSHVTKFYLWVSPVPWGWILCINDLAPISKRIKFCDSTCFCMEIK